jgi:hypothetical protein
MTRTPCIHRYAIVSAGCAPWTPKPFLVQSTQRNSAYIAANPALLEPQVLRLIVERSP